MAGPRWSAYSVRVKDACGICVDHGVVQTASPRLALDAYFRKLCRKVVWATKYSSWRELVSAAHWQDSTCSLCEVTMVGGYHSNFYLIYTESGG